MDLGACWSPHAINFTSGYSQVSGLFVSDENNIYGSATNTTHVYVWHRNSSTPFLMINDTSNFTADVFVSGAGDIYTNGDTDQRVYRWLPNGTRREMVMNVSASCSGLFIDINATLCCSVSELNQVFRVSLNSSSTSPMLVAGNDSAGSTADKLSQPNGIFVDLNFDLYVADSNNSRVQKFRDGNRTGETVAGNGSMGIISLKYPTDVVLDENGTLYIVDSGNNRIVAVGLYGLRCIAGCFGPSGSASNLLSSPHSLAFDNMGNLYVSDYGNNRILKFIVNGNFCGKSDKCSTNA